MGAAPGASGADVVLACQQAAAAFALGRLDIDWDPATGAVRSLAGP